MRQKCLNCDKNPSFNYKGESRRLYCSEHKLDGMINVTGKTCLNCDKESSYNYKGETRRLYCSEHKLDGMINITGKKCLMCDKQPVFNFKGESKRLYCSEHKLDGMINVTEKTCLECNIVPSFNYIGEKQGIYCVKHKLKDMINVKVRLCLNCDVRPSFNYIEEHIGIYCHKHKLDGMINVIQKKCKSDWCDTQVKNRYDGYCLLCYIYLFPDKPISKNYKTKETYVVNFVLQYFPHENFTWMTDKMISNGCSKRRPDIMLDLGYQIIIIEIDENQHRYYDCSCNNKRLMELSQDVGHRPIIFIRFNPDEYINNENKRITSCWTISKKLGLLIIKKQKREEWNNRLNVLKEQIEFWLNPKNRTDKTIEVIELFYDSN